MKNQGRVRGKEGRRKEVNDTEEFRLDNRALGYVSQGNLVHDNTGYHLLEEVDRHRCS